MPKRRVRRGIFTEIDAPQRLLVTALTFAGFLGLWLFAAAVAPKGFPPSPGQSVGRVEWDLTGVHNQQNALAAIAAAQHVGVAPAIAAGALHRFRNVKRRMEVRGTVAGITVYDDFAHHPTAIRTTLDGLRRRVGPCRTSSDGAVSGTRILAVFEPRSTTMKLGVMNAQLAWSLEPADLAFCHSGGLGWDPHEALAPMGARAHINPNLDALVGQVREAARTGDHIVCMSNGNFGGIHARLLDALRSN